MDTPVSKFVKFEKFEKVTGMVRILSVPDNPCGMGATLTEDSEIKPRELLSFKEVALDVRLPRLIPTALGGNKQNEPVVSLNNRNSTKTIDTAKFRRSLFKLPRSFLPFRKRRCTQ